jgi:hypothetical protein
VPIDPTFVTPGRILPQMGEIAMWAAILLGFIFMLPQLAEWGLAVGDWLLHLGGHR